MVANTLELGIHILNGGNLEVQTVMLRYLQEKQDMGFFISLDRLMSRCSVLNLEMFERQVKAEGFPFLLPSCRSQLRESAGQGWAWVRSTRPGTTRISTTSDSPAASSASSNSPARDTTTTSRSRPYSAHHSDGMIGNGGCVGVQNYIRAQPGNASSMNLLLSAVDYLLRLQESIMDFYWHYSSKSLIDAGGTAYFLKAIKVCSQVPPSPLPPPPPLNPTAPSHRSSTSSRRPARAPASGTKCPSPTPDSGTLSTGERDSLGSRLRPEGGMTGWPRFFFLFAHMMDKLSKASSQLELLKEFLNLQKDMVVLMLSLLEGNVLNGTIGKQTVSTHLPFPCLTQLT